MLNQVIELDKELFIFLNSLHSPYLDEIMLFVSNSMVPIFFFLGLFLVYGYIKFKTKIIFLFIFMAIIFGLSDVISSRVLKPTTKRLRPCHELQDTYRAQNGCGGKYGFVSAHASNYFAVLTFMWLLFKRFNRGFIILIPYALLVSYSRIYLARHYFLDIFFGAILGITITMFMYNFIKSKTSLLKY